MPAESPEPTHVPGDRPSRDRSGDRPFEDRSSREASAKPAESAGSWDPEGLSMARAVAASVAAASGAVPGRRRSARGGSGRTTPDRSGRARPQPGAASGAGPDDRDPQLLDATLDRLIAERGWSTDVAVAGALARWDDIVGPEIAAHCRAERYADAELTVRADSTAWATQVRLLAPAVVKRLNEELGDGTVRRVNVLGPAAPNWRKGSRSIRDGRGPRDTYG